MPLKALVEDIETVDEAQRGLYVEQKDDAGTVVGHRLDVEAVNGWELNDFQGAKNTMGTLRGQVRDLEGKAKIWDGMDHTQTAKDLADYAKIKDLDPEGKAKTIAQSQIDQMATKHADELNGKDADVDRFKGIAYKLGITSTIKSALIEAGALPEMVGILEPHVAKFIKGDFKDDDLVVSVVNDKNEPRVNDAVGTPMSIGNLVAEVKLAMPGLFDGKGASGSDTSTKNSDGDGGGAKKRSEMTPTQKAKYVAEHGQQKFLALPR